MSIRDCLKAGGVTDEETIRRVENMYDTRTKEGMSKDSARQLTFDQLTEEGLQAERAGMLNVAAEMRMVKEVNQTVNWRGKLTPWKWLRDSLSSKGGQPYGDVASLQESIYRVWMGNVEEMIYELRPGWAQGARRRRTGSRVKLQADILKGLYEETVSDNVPATDMAAAWTKLRLRMIGEYNDAGGRIKLLKNTVYGIAQDPNSDLIRAANKPDFIKDTVENLNLEKMINHGMNRRYTRAELEEIAGYVYDNLASEGALALEEAGSKVKGKSLLGGRYADHRVLHFKGSKGWLKWAKKYGNTDIGETMVSDMHTMSRDLAQLKRFGQNPTRNRERIERMLLIQAKKDKGGIHVETPDDVVEEFGSHLASLAREMKPAAKRLAKEVTDIHKRLLPLRQRVLGKVGSLKKTPGKRKGKAWKELTDVEAELHAAEDRLRAQMPDDIQSKPEMAKEFADLLNEGNSLQFRTFSKDPVSQVEKEIDKAKALWNVVSDEIPLNGHRRVKNIFQGVRDILSSAMLGTAFIVSFTDNAFSIGARDANKLSLKNHIPQLLRGLKSGSRRDAVRAGLGFERAGEAFRVEMRQAHEMNAKSWTGALATSSLSMSGLLGITRIQKIAMGDEIMGFVAENAGVAFRDLDDEIQGMFTRNAITAADWDKLVTAPRHHRGGLDYDQQIRISDVDTIDRDLAYRYGAMIRRIQYHATPEPDARIRATMYGGEHKGIRTELWKTTVLFKSFPVTVLLDQIRRTGELLAESGMNKAAANLAFTVIAGTVLGMAAIDSRDLVSGRLPDFAERWSDPMHWGAGFTQGTGFGILGDVVRSAGSTRFGGDYWDVLKGAAWGKMDKLYKGARQGNWAKVGREVGRTLPYNNMWWARILIERYIVDAMEHLSGAAGGSPGQGKTNFRNRDKFWSSEFDTKHWWKPGKKVPEFLR